MKVSKRPVKLVDAPTGIFKSVGGGYGFKTEYRDSDGGIQAYCIDSGEAWCGPPPQTLQSQRDAMVHPVDFQSLLKDVAMVGELAAKCDRLEKELLREKDLHRKAARAMDASVGHLLSAYDYVLAMQGDISSHIENEESAEE